MAPVAVPSMDDLKLDESKVEKKPDVVNDEEGDDDDDEEGEGGETAATGGRSILDALRTQNILGHPLTGRRCKEEEKEEEA